MRHFQKRNDAILLIIEIVIIKKFNQKFPNKWLIYLLIHNMINKNIYSYRYTRY